jgi:hypothetical protein
MKLSMDMDELLEGDKRWLEMMITPYLIHLLEVSRSGSWYSHVLRRASVSDIVSGKKPAADWNSAIIENRL